MSNTRSIDTKYIEDTIAYLRDCIEKQREDQAHHKAEGNVILENWYQGRSEAFEDVARWLERDIKLFANLNKYKAA